MLTTHDMGDIEDLCERMVIIDYGKIIYDGTLTEVKNRYARERTMRIETVSIVDEPARASLSETFVALSVTTAYPSEKEVYITFDKDGVPVRELINRVINMLDIKDFTIDEPKIDTVIKRVYSHSLDIQRMDAE